MKKIPENTEVPWNWDSLRRFGRKIWPKSIQGSLTVWIDRKVDDHRSSPLSSEFPCKPQVPKPRQPHICLRYQAQLWSVHQMWQQSNNWVPGMATQPHLPLGEQTLMWLPPPRVWTACLPSAFASPTNAIKFGRIWGFVKELEAMVVILGTSILPDWWRNGQCPKVFNFDEVQFIILLLLVWCHI